VALLALQRDTHAFERAGMSVQEQQLAPRNVYSSEVQLYWECFGCLASETFPEGLPPGANTSPKSLDPHIGGALVRQSQGLRPNPNLDRLSAFDHGASPLSNPLVNFGPSNQAGSPSGPRTLK
jgi:hypothetical protein